MDLRSLISAALGGERPEAEAALALLPDAPSVVLAPAAEALTARGFGSTVSYSRKVFIPLTHLCRDICHYCTFAKVPRDAGAPYLDLDQVLTIARAGATAGCKEALFTLGDKPELRYPAARRWLRAQGFDSTVDYLHEAAERVLTETGLLPHLNPGVLTLEDLQRLRPASASMGLMLETTADRLSQRGGPHWGSLDKAPAVRLATLRAAARRRSRSPRGLLIGIGETRRERIEALLAIRDLHDLYGHVQEIIIQNFRAKSPLQWRTRSSPRWRSTCGRWRRRGWCSGPPCQSISNPMRWVGWCAQALMTGGRIAGHARPRESRGALATPVRARDPHRRSGTATHRTAGDRACLPPASRSPARSEGSDRTRCARRMQSAWRGRTTGSPVL